MGTQGRAFSLQMSSYSAFFVSFAQDARKPGGILLERCDRD